LRRSSWGLARDVPPTPLICLLPKRTAGEVAVQGLPNYFYVTIYHVDWVWQAATGPRNARAGGDSGQLRTPSPAWDCGSGDTGNVAENKERKRGGSRRIESSRPARVSETLSQKQNMTDEWIKKMQFLYTTE
jgi:hypothetical protein